MNASESKGFYKTEFIPVVSDDILKFFVFVSVAFIPILAVPGVVFNVINVIVFTRMGMRDTTNISLVALAVADIGSQLTMIGFSITSSPLTAVAVSSRETLSAIDYNFIGSPHTTFSRISGLLTGLISFERILCVAWPLRIRTLVTRRRTSLAVVVIYVMMFVSTVPTYMAHPLGMKLDPQLNITVFGVIYRANTERLEIIHTNLNVAFQITSFAVVTVSTLFLARSLHTAALWRGAVAGQASKSSRRDKKLIKMVVLISTVFIISSLPTVVTFFLISFFPEMRLNVGNNNLILTVVVGCFELHAISTTLNIFIYLTGSSKFKTHFFAMFGVLLARKKCRSIYFKKQLLSILKTQ